MVGDLISRDMAMRENWLDETLPLAFRGHVNEMLKKLPAEDAVETVRDKDLAKAIKMLKLEYEAAKRKEFVHSPLAYALYRTWKKVDEDAGRSNRRH